jgi:hypothetical protein
MARLLSMTNHQLSHLQALSDIYCRSALQLRLMFEREFEQGVMAFEFEFLADAGAVVFDGAGAEAEFVSDLLARFVFRR